jgi:hypothetical protein
MRNTSSSFFVPARFLLPEVVSCSVCQLANLTQLRSWRLVLLIRVLLPLQVMHPDRCSGSSSRESRLAHRPDSFCCWFFLLNLFNRSWSSCDGVCYSSMLLVVAGEACSCFSMSWSVSFKPKSICLSCVESGLVLESPDQRLEFF